MELLQFYASCALISAEMVPRILWYRKSALVFFVVSIVLLSGISQNIIPSSLLRVFVCAIIVFLASVAIFMSRAFQARSRFRRE